MKHILWYRSPSDVYMEGLPMGNGRLALMAVGGPAKLRLAINHEWMWRGENRFRDFEDVSTHLPEVRKALLEGDFLTGTRLANDYFGGTGGISDKPNRVDPYQPVGDVWIEGAFGETANYTRSLDLDTGLVSVSFDAACGRVTEEVFVSAADGCGVARVTTEHPQTLSITLSRVPDEHCTLTYAAGERGITMNGAFQDGIRFAAEIRAETDGVLTTAGDTVTVHDATCTVIYLQAGTDAKGALPTEEMTFPSCADFDRLFEAHTAAFRTLKGNAVLDVDVRDSDLPTDERIAAFRAGHEPAMPLLYFEYGRYLMASGSSGELPLNLQGKWNEDLQPPWEADYHLDINLEMCYWFVETLGMDRAADTLFNLIERYTPFARELAKKLYGCDGVVMGIQTDVWGRVTPESYGWAVWIGAAPWLGQHLYRHYLYTRDASFLKTRCYPFLKEVAAFYRSYLVPHGEQLWILPSQSPENRFAGTGKFPVSIGINSAMDIELANDTLTAAIDCAETLGEDADLIPLWKDMLRRLVKLSIDSRGRLNEFDCEREEVEPGHRHVSHLYGLFPSEQFAPGSALWNAAEKSLDARMACGGGHTGWSRSWVACLMARLGRAEEAWEHFIHLIGDFATTSLLDLHPPRIYQIDGNMGGTACVCEMLLQSRKDALILLPALPEAWPKGSVANFRAQGRLCVSFDWEDRRVTRCTLSSDIWTSTTVEVNGQRIPVTVYPGVPCEVELDPAPAN